MYFIKGFLKSYTYFFKKNINHSQIKYINLNENLSIYYEIDISRSIDFLRLSFN